MDTTIYISKFTLSFLILIITGCSVQKDYSYNLNIVDEELLYTNAPGTSFIAYGITGKTYKAIDPRYISNRNGYTESSYYEKDTKKMVSKSFELIAFDDCFTCDNGNLASSLSAAKSWNYYINDMLMIYYSRAIVSALMLHAIEKVEYIPIDTVRTLFTTQLHNQPYIKEDHVNGVAAVKIETRNITQNAAMDRHTLYLLDGTEITSKIFNAINPIYIKSLKRVTDKVSLQELGKKGIREIVTIELFSLFEVESKVLTDGAKSLLIVDNIMLPSDIENKLNGFFFKKVEHFSHENEDYSSIIKKHPTTDWFTIISLH